MDLIEKSVDLLENKIDIRKLWRAGFRRDPIKYYMVSTYPPIGVAKRVSERDVFSGSGAKNKRAVLYFHIPFCSRKCTCCPYFKTTDHKGADEYLRYLKRELVIARKYLTGCSGIAAVYIGGGTPTSLRPEQLGGLLGFIRKHLPLPKTTEITVEVHPEIFRTGPEPYIEVLKENGVNRISIGMQTFNDDILRCIRRGHTAEESIGLFKRFRKAGFPYINIDILNGLPDQTIRTWARDLETAYRLNPDCVTTYYMGIRDWTEIYKQYKNEAHRFPGEYLQHLFSVMASEKARLEGRVQVPVSYSAKSKNHFRYATDVFARPEEGSVFGLGVSSHSYVNGWQYFNYHTFEEYYRAIGSNELPIWKGTKLSLEDRMARTVMFNLRYLLRVDKDKFRLFFDQDLNRVYGTPIGILRNLGLLKESRKGIALTYAGTLFTEELCNLFIPVSRVPGLRGSREKYDRFYKIG
jgi:oxygen-independent coproporphyrinogen-3 oxidase